MTPAFKVVLSPSIPLIYICTVWNHSHRHTGGKVFAKDPPDISQAIQVGNRGCAPRVPIGFTTYYSSLNSSNVPSLSQSLSFTQLQIWKHGINVLFLMSTPYSVNPCPSFNQLKLVSHLFFFTCIIAFFSFCCFFFCCCCWLFSEMDKVTDFIITN